MAQRREGRLVHELISQSAIEACDEGVLDRLARYGVVSIYRSPIRPLRIKSLVNSMPIGARNHLRLALSLDDLVKLEGNPQTGN